MTGTKGTTGIFIMSPGKGIAATPFEIIGKGFSPSCMDFI
jgi:hypothetical protein